jgi:hypothetical protein
MITRSCQRIALFKISKRFAIEIRGNQEKDSFVALANLKSHNLAHNSSNE